MMRRKLKRREKMKRLSCVRLGVLFIALLLNSEASRLSHAISATNELRQAASSLDALVNNLLPTQDPQTAINNMQRFAQSPLAEKFATAFDKAHPVLQLVPAVMARHPNVTAMLVRSRVADIAVSFLQVLDQLLPQSPDTTQRQPPSENSFWNRLSRSMDANSAEWDQAMGLAVGRPAGELDQVLLQFDEAVNMTDYNNNKVAVSHSFVETLLNYDTQTKWATSMAHNRLIFMILALFLVIVLALTIFVAVYNVTNSDRKKQFGMVGYCFLFAWVSVALYMILTSLELVAFNHVTLLVYDAVMDAMNKPQDFLNAVQVAKPDTPGLVANIRDQLTNIFTAITGGLSSSEADQPVFCTSAYTEGDSVFNSYPSGSVIRDYNLRRLADQTTDAQPLLDYVKTVLLAEPYPTSAGGISSREARLVHAISNECDEEGGNITRCCDPTRALNDVDFQLRCPGKVMSDQAGDNHCRCIEVVTKLGFDVESKQLARCVNYVKSKVQTAISGWTGQDISISTARGDMTQVYGCTGVYDAADTTITGAVTKTLYHNVLAYTDRDSFDVRSAYVNTTSTTGTGSVVLTLSNCMAGPHTIQLRTSYNSFSSNMNMALSNVTGYTYSHTVSPPSTGAYQWTTGEVISTLTMQAGNQILTISGQIPPIHQIYVCNGGDSTLGCITN